MNKIAFTFRNTEHLITEISNDNPIYYHNRQQLSTDVFSEENTTVVLTDEFIAPFSFGVICKFIEIIPKPLEITFYLPPEDVFITARQRILEYALKRDKENGTIAARSKTIFKLLRLMNINSDNEDIRNQFAARNKTEYNWMKRYGPLFTKDEWHQTYNYYHKCSTLLTSS